MGLLLSIMHFYIPLFFFSYASPARPLGCIINFAGLPSTQSISCKVLTSVQENQYFPSLGRSLGFVFSVISKVKVKNCGAKIFIHLIKKNNTTLRWRDHFPFSWKGLHLPRSSMLKSVLCTVTVCAVWNNWAITLLGRSKLCRIT